MAEKKKRLPEGYLARGVPGDYDGSTPLPDDLHERFARLVSEGATPTSAIRTVHPNADKLKTPVQAAAILAKKEHVKRRIRWLREERSRTLASEENLFAGFVHAVEQAMASISELVKLATLEGLPREAAAARKALGSLAGRTFTHRPSLENADRRGTATHSRAKAIMKEIFGDEAER